MQNVIYIDVLVFLNIIITFLLLTASSRLMKLSPGAGRLLIGSLLGGASSLIILAPDMGFLLSLMTKLLFSVIIVAAVYNPKDMRSIFRQTGYFFVVSFLFAGMMLFVGSLPGIHIVSYNNGAVYVDFSFLSLVAASALCYIITCILGKITGHRVCNTLCSVEIVVNGKTVTGQAIIDTGNTLCDPFSGESIVIADRFFLKTVLPPDVKKYLDGMAEECEGIRLIPCSTVSADGLLPVFRAEMVRLRGDGFFCEMKRTPIAVSKNKMSSAIIPAELAVNCERRKENAETAK